MSKKTNYTKELEKIFTLRNDAYKLDFITLVFIFLIVLSQLFIPVFMPIFGFLAFYRFYSKLKKAARYPCPKCKEPFGSKDRFVMGVGTLFCQNCGLSLDIA